MNTLVVKGDCFSNNNKRTLEDCTVIDLDVVFVYPTGITESIKTNRELFLKVNAMEDESIIYGDECLKEYSWNCHECKYTHHGFDRHKLIITSTSGHTSEDWLCNDCAKEFWGVENA